MPSDALLNFVRLSGLTVFLLIIALLVTIAILRYAAERRKRLEAALSRRWQPVFFHAVEGLPFEAPRVFGRDREIILLIWIHFTESIRGDARLRLRQLALDLKLDRTAHILLKRGSIRSRMMAIVALGRMQSVEVRDQIALFVTDPSPMLSLLAARSLLQIDASRGIRTILDELVRRDDWPLRSVAAMLAELPRDVLAAPLIDAVKDSPASSTSRLLRLLSTLNLGDTWDVLAPLLGNDKPVEILVAALKACSDPRALAAVRHLAGHEQWIVRAQAAAALGRLGNEPDGLLLQTMLGDPEWWVRYRAARALLELPSVSRQYLIDLCGKLDDRFAADILRQALAEVEPDTAPK